MEEKIIIQKKPPKSPGFAGFLSAIFPFGIGAMYNGLYVKGLVYLIMFAALVSFQRFGRAQPFMALMLAGFYFYQVIESVQTAAAINRKALTGKEDEAVTVEDQILEPAKSGSVFWGAVLIGLGVLFLLANFDVIDYGSLFDFWPVAVIGLGIKIVFDSISRSRKQG